MAARKPLVVIGGAAQELPAADYVTADNADVIGKVLTGFASGAGTVAATDSILAAIQKLNGNDGQKQPLDSDLTTLAGLTATTDNFIVSVASAWASRTPAQVRTTLGLVIGTNVQAWDADLDTWAGKTAPSGTVVGTTDTQVLPNKAITPRVVSPAVAGTYTIDVTATDVYVIGTQNAAITNLTTTGALVDGQRVLVRVKGDATPRAITWDSAKIVSSGIATLLSTTAASKTHHVLLIADGTLGKLVCLAADSSGY